MYFNQCYRACWRRCFASSVMGSELFIGLEARGVSIVVLFLDMTLSSDYNTDVDESSSHNRHISM